METKRFAWLPKCVTSGKWVWLSYFYEHRLLYDESTGRPPLNTFEFVWSETAKEKTRRLLKESVKSNRNVWNDYNLTKEDTI